MKALNLLDIVKQHNGISNAQGNISESKTGTGQNEAISPNESQSMKKLLRFSSNVVGERSDQNEIKSSQLTRRKLATAGRHQTNSLNPTVPVEFGVKLHEIKSVQRLGSATEQDLETIAADSARRLPGTERRNLAYFTNNRQSQKGIMSPVSVTGGDPILYSQNSYDSYQAMTARNRSQAQLNESDNNAIWNRQTFSFTMAKMRPRLTITSGSEYLTRMKNHRADKLSKVYDVEKNRVKSKRSLLEDLRTELQQVRFLNGAAHRQIDEDTNLKTKDESKEIEDSTQSIQPVIIPTLPQPTQSLMSKFNLKFLRPHINNKGAFLTSFSKSMSISSNIAHLGPTLTTNTMTQSNQISPRIQSKPPPVITSAAQMSNTLYQPYFPMSLDDETIQANLLALKEDLEKKLQAIEFKHQNEYFVQQQLQAQHSKENKELTSLTLRHRDMQPEQKQYTRAVENIPRMKMLGDTSAEQAKNLLGERRKELEKRKEFYNSVLQKKIAALRVSSKELDEVKAAIAKREKRVGEMKEYLAELKQSNKEEEVRKQVFINQVMNKNLEFKVLSGLEVIVKLEQALKAIDHSSSQDPLSSLKQQQGMDSILDVQKNALIVDDLTTEDLEAMNKKRIEQLKGYEKHFATCFPDISQISINDQYLLKRYLDVSFSIHSYTSKYQELVQTNNIKRKLIKQYLRFKGQMEKDKEFLEAKTKVVSIVGSDSFIQKEEGSLDQLEPNFNDMKNADVLTRLTNIQQDIQQKQQLVAQACTLIITALEKYSYVLLEIFQFCKIEQVIPGRERLGPEQVPLTDYISSDFLLLLSKYAQRFVLDTRDNNSEAAKQQSSQQQIGSNGNGQKQSESPSKKASAPATNKENTSAQGTRIKAVGSGHWQPQKKLYSSTVVGSFVAAGSTSKHEKEPQSAVSLNFGNATNNKTYSPNKVSSAHQRTTANGKGSSNYFNLDIDDEDDNILENFHLSKMEEDLIYFIQHVVINQEQNQLINALDQGYNREILHPFAVQYIKQSKYLSKILDCCTQTRRLQETFKKPNHMIHPTIYGNGLEVQMKNQNIFLLDENHVSRGDDSDFVPEEDYIDPHSKHIITKLLVEDKRHMDLEIRRKNKQIEREKQLAKMTESQRREQNRLRLKKQVASLKDFEKDELSFRNQFKTNAFEVFSQQRPKARETNKFLVLDGQMISSMTGILLEHQKDPYRHYDSLIPADEVELTTSPVMERSNHKMRHTRLSLQSQQIRGRFGRGYKSPVQQPGSDLFSVFSSPQQTQQSIQSLNTASGDSGFNKPHTQRVLERNMLRRTVVKLDKPEKKSQNVVLQMLQERYPELEKLFMDTAQRRTQQRNIQMQIRLGTHDSDRNGGMLNSGKQTTSSQNSNYMATNPYDDDTTQMAGTVGGDDQMSGVGGYGSTIGDNQSFEERVPIIKVKPVFPKGVIIK